MDNYKEETSELLVNDNNNNAAVNVNLAVTNSTTPNITNITNNTTRSASSNSQPIPANRLALAAQIEAAAEHQRRLKRQRRIYYITSIVTITMITFFIISFVAWIIHTSDSNPQVAAKRLLLNEIDSISAIQDEEMGNSTSNWHTLNARKHPTRTIDEKVLLKRADEESDEDKDTVESDLKAETSTNGQLAPTRTRKLSFAPEKIIDFKVHAN